MIQPPPELPTYFVEQVDQTVYSLRVRLWMHKTRTSYRTLAKLSGIKHGNLHKMLHNKINMNLIQARSIDLAIRKIPAVRAVERESD